MFTTVAYGLGLGRSSTFWKAYQVYFPTDLDSWLYLIRCFRNRRFNAGAFSAFGAVSPYFGLMAHVSSWVH
jgi:hypothetical protein